MTDSVCTALVKPFYACERFRAGHYMDPCWKCGHAFNQHERRDLSAAKEQAPITPNNAPQATLFAMGMQRHDEIIPGRGAPYVDPTTGFTHVRFTRPGVEGEFHLVFKVDHTPPFERNS